MAGIGICGFSTDGRFVEALSLGASEKDQRQLFNQFILAKHHRIYEGPIDGFNWLHRQKVVAGIG
jgi:hypothetical protein